MTLDLLPPALRHIGHADLLADAVAATTTREAWSTMPARPDREPGADEAMAAAQRGVAGLHGTTFELAGPRGGQAMLGEEVSPYTHDRLGVSYTRHGADALMDTATTTHRAWQQVDWATRVDLALEVAMTLGARLHLIARANHHTTGQSMSMSHIGSGANAIDRGVEAIAQAAMALGRVPRRARWSQAFGRTEVTLDKRYEVRGRGPAVVITCASFPTWNAYPALLANLAAGNAVVVKPHPSSILTMAMMVEAAQDVLAAAGLPREIVQLAVDTATAPIAKELIGHPATRIVDFTGSAAFGGWIEANAHPAIAFTETSGVNTVVLESADDLDAVAAAIATSLTLFSAQMCTSVQNIHVPAEGVRTPEGMVGPTEVATVISDAVGAIVEVPRRAAGVAGAVQAEPTRRRIQDLAARAEVDGRLVRAPLAYEHPEYANARTLTPAVVAVDAPAVDGTPPEVEGFADEVFGPVGAVITSPDRDTALATATDLVARNGAIASHVYSTNRDWGDRAVAAYLDAGASVSRNLTGPMPLNFSAAFSDYHVTGLGPAGNACLTDEAFVAGRFRIVQEREPASAAAPGGAPEHDSD